LLNRLLFPIYNIHEDDCSCEYMDMIIILFFASFYCALFLLLSFGRFSSFFVVGVFTAGEFSDKIKYRETLSRASSQAEINFLSAFDGLLAIRVASHSTLRAAFMEGKVEE
jgi:hypothetical protein